MKWLPNALTILRCVLAFVVGWAILETGFGQPVFYHGGCEAHPSFHPDCPRSSVWGGWPFVLFVVAALLDYFDGLAARLLDASSEFGAWLDPLADKLLVGITLLAISASYGWHAMFVIPTVLIIGRDIVVTFLRNRITGGIPVSKAAKWKTAIAMIATGGMLLFFRPWHFGLPMDPSEIGGAASVILLYLAAALSLYTAFQYVRAAFSQPTL